MKTRIHRWYRVYTIIILLCNGFLLNAQIQNGSFEIWGKESNGSDVPAFWDYLLPNNDDCIEPSGIASDGILALTIASSNIGPGTPLAPAYLGTEVLPPGISNKLTFDYLIDALVGESQGKIEIYQKNHEGEYRIVTYTVFSEMGNEYTSDAFDFNLPHQDSIVIVIIAENHAIPFGYDGFIRFTIDNLRLEVKTGTNNLSTERCVINPTLANDKITVSFPNAGFIKCKAVIYSLQTGRRISTTNVDNSTGPMFIATCDLPNGVYMLQFISDNKFIESKKFTVFHD